MTNLVCCGSSTDSVISGGQFFALNNIPFLFSTRNRTRVMPSIVRHRRTPDLRSRVVPQYRYAVGGDDTCSPCATDYLFQRLKGFKICKGTRF